MQKVLEREYWRSQTFYLKANFFVSLLALIVAGIAGVIAFSTFGESQRATLLGNRAWIAPEKMALNLPLETGEPLHIALLIENTGKVPALDLTYRFTSYGVPYIPENSNGFEISSMNLACQGVKVKDHSGPTVFSGKGDFYILYSFPDSLENRSAVRQAQDRRISIVIDGCLKYRTMDEEHQTSFRYFLRDNQESRSCELLPGNEMKCYWAFNKLAGGDQAD